MPKDNETRQPPWEEERGRETASFGTWLRQQRQIREVNLDDIADATKISIRYLEALEQDRFDVLPAPVFAKGFLREYSKFVGLDPDEVVNSYLNAAEEPAEDELPVVQAAPAEPGTAKNIWILLAVLLAAVSLIALLVYWAGRSQTDQVPPPIAAPILPEAPPPAAPTEPVQEVPLLVTLDFTKDCWVEATVDGARRLSELHVQGESMRLEAESEVRLTLGNPEGVEIEVNGEPYQFPYTAGQVARDLVLAAAEPAATAEDAGSDAGSAAGQSLAGDAG